MRTWLIGIAVTVVAAGLGVGAAYGGSQLVKTYRPEIAEAVRSARGQDVRGAGDGAAYCDPARLGGIRDRLKGRIERFCGRRSGWNGSADSDRITLETAASIAETYAADLGSEFRVAEVMEFERNFYAVVIERETGRGAFELLIDPYRGAVSPEPGPNMMWNTKYGGPMHRSGSGGENGLSIEEARSAAQKYLSELIPGATVDEGGFSFYGYYTFDYSVDGRTAGMLSVNGSTGDTWLHTWHGEFVAEKEMEE